MEKKVGKSDVDYMELLYENDNISIYELDAVTLGPNRHGMSIDEACIERSLTSFADAPLYCIIDNQYNPLDSQHNDFLEHFREEYPYVVSRDRVLPFGTVPESAIKSAKLVERDGHTYLRIQVVVWKRLLPHISEILTRRDGDVKVSVEFTLDDTSVDKETGILNIHKFTITAITALGAKFTEAMEGSRLKLAKFSYNSYFDDCKKGYCMFSEQKEFDVPENVLNSIKNGIQLREKYGRGSTPTQYHNMVSVVNRKKMLQAEASDIQAYFSAVGDAIPEGGRAKTNKFILYNMYGGDECKLWLNDIYNSDADVISNSKGGKDELDKNVENAEKKMRINNTKEAAVTSKEWKNPGKALYEPLFEASNVNSLIYEAYLIAEDGFQDAPSEKLKYPHHVVKDGELVIDVTGVEAALKRAIQQDIFKGQVYDHLKRHYKELGLDMKVFNAVDSEEGDDSKMEKVKNADSNEDIDYKVKIKGQDVKVDNADDEDDDDDTNDDIDYKVKVKGDDVEVDNADDIETLKAENKKMAEQLAKFIHQEEVAKAKASIDEFKHCFDPDMLNTLMSDAEVMNEADFSAKLCDAVMDFARGLGCQNSKDVAKFSVPETEIRKNPFYMYNKDVVREKTTSELEGVMKRQKTKVN